MKKAIIYTTSPDGHQVTWGTAFRDGLRRHGWNAEISKERGHCDLLAMWGVRRNYITQEQLKCGGEMVILERGYIDDRFKYCSVSFGGKLNGRATFRGPFKDPTRWEKNFSHIMKPWRQGGEYILILGQVEGDASIDGVDIIGFYNEACEAFSKLGYEVRFRPHPLSRPTRKPIKPQKVAGNLPLEEDLKTAIAAVTFNSNSGVDAVMMGVPTVAKDKGSMAWDVTGHSFSLPQECDRRAWAYALAWKQWTLEEMASGECWEHIGRELVE